MTSVKPRPFSRSSYYELRDCFETQSQQYRNILAQLEYELGHRKVSWSVQLRRKITEQIKRLNQ